MVTQACVNARQVTPVDVYIMYTYFATISLCGKDKSIAELKGGKGLPHKHAGVNAEYNWC